MSNQLVLIIALMTCELSLTGTTEHVSHISKTHHHVKPGHYKPSTNPESDHDHHSFNQNTHGFRNPEDTLILRQDPMLDEGGLLLPIENPHPGEIQEQTWFEIVKAANSDPMNWTVLWTALDKGYVELNGHPINSIQDPNTKDLFHSKWKFVYHRVMNNVWNKKKHAKPIVAVSAISVTQKPVVPNMSPSNIEQVKVQSNGHHQRDESIDIGSHHHQKKNQHVHGHLNHQFQFQHEHKHHQLSSSSQAERWTQQHQQQITSSTHNPSSKNYFD